MAMQDFIDRTSLIACNFDTLFTGPGRSPVCRQAGLQELSSSKLKARLVYKWRLLSAAMDAGLDVMYSDADAVPLRNPFR